MYGNNQTPQFYGAPDATQEFNAVLSDPSRWIIKLGVPIFKPHERVDPNSGKLIQVDVPKLYRIAQNMQQMERGGVPVRITLGHTEPGKAEVEQPPVVGYYRNPRVQPFGPKGEPAIVVDEWLDPQWGHKRKDTPYRSSEYYDDTESITGVALLTRDPFLDLGVVAYRSGQAPTMYDRRLNQAVPFSAAPGTLLAYTQDVPVVRPLNPATGRVPVMYRLTLGEVPMYPPGAPAPTQYGQPFMPYPQPPVPPVTMTSALPTAMPTPYAAAPTYAPPAPPAAYAAPQYAPPPAPYAAPPAPAPTPYGVPVLGQFGGHYARPSMHRTHPSQWNYRRGRRPAPYADGPPPGAGGNPLETVYECLVEATTALQQLMEGMSQAPQEPFPGQGGPPPGPGGPGGGGPEPTPSGAYGRYGRSAPRGAMRPYGQPQAPTQYGADPQRTISGLPVGYQLKMDQLQYQLGHANNAIKVLMYERDQADTQECVAEIRRLAASGYPVGDEEVAELKKTPRQYRPQYLDRIAAKYQRVPVDGPPPLLGDPTPGPSQLDPLSRPASQDEMEAALRLSSTNPEVGSFTQALNYVRSGQAPTAYGAVNRIANVNPLEAITGAAWAPGAAAPGGFDPRNPYADPSLNGRG